MIVKHLGRDSALFTEIHGPEKTEWDTTNQLLAVIADTLRWLQWAKTKDGARGRNAPKPIERPGVDNGSRHIGDAAPIEEIMRMTGVTDVGF